MYSNATMPTAPAGPRFMPSSVRPQQAPLEPPAFRGDSQFMKMMTSYRQCGGLARMQEVLTRARRQQGPNAASFERWTSQREVISFLWQGHTWLPLAQFHRFDMSPLPRLHQVLEVLNPTLDSLEVAQWFATPNPLLTGRPPASSLANRPALVLEAARAALRNHVPVAVLENVYESAGQWATASPR